MGKMFFLITVLIFIVGIYFYYKRHSLNTNKTERVLTQDPKAQEQYLHLKHKDEEKEQTLSMEERIQLSWQFLKNITDKVLSNFSKQDQKMVHKQGEILINNGMSYQHNVELEIKQNIAHSQAVLQNKQQDKERQR